MEYPKREKDDRWGIIRFNTTNGKVHKVQIGGWELSSFIWPKQAREFALDGDAIAKEFNHPEFYETIYDPNIYCSDCVQSLTRMCHTCYNKHYTKQIGA
jgi:hypothetical protein